MHSPVPLLLESGGELVELAVVHDDVTWALRVHDVDAQQVVDRHLADELANEW